jgi:hypothetical protein
MCNENKNNENQWKWIIIENNVVIIIMAIIIMWKV